MTELRRTGIGPFRVEDAFGHPKNVRPEGAVTISEIFPNDPVIEVSDEGAVELLGGRNFQPEFPLPDADRVFITKNGDPISLCRSHE